MFVEKGKERQKKGKQKGRILSYVNIKQINSSLMLLLHFYDFKLLALVYNPFILPSSLLVL